MNPHLMTERLPATWSQVMTNAGWRCECVTAGGCGHSTRRCKIEQLTAGKPRLLAVPTNPLLPWVDAASLPAGELRALCVRCAEQERTSRRREERRDAAGSAQGQMGLFGEEVHP